MNLWGEEIPAQLLTAQEETYLEPFAQRPRLALDEMWQALDEVWRGMELDRHRSDAVIAAYYAHPVWMLNGIFTATDPVSAAHRRAIARWLADFGARRIADFGGGGGQLAREMAMAMPEAQIDIIEPYPSRFSLHRTAGIPNIRWTATLDGEYDSVIAQDVLEHVPDPVGTSAMLVAAVRGGGVNIFANCFFPVIQCHLPETFFLRHTFDTVVRPLGINFRQPISGAEHARVYVRQDGPSMADEGISRARQREAMARVVGPVLNMVWDAAAGVRCRLMGSGDGRG